MTLDYSQDKFPPAPILKIQLSAPREALQTEVLSALVDTGADFTLVPKRWLAQINAPESRSALVRGLWSSRTRVTLYFVDIHFNNVILPGLKPSALMRTTALSRTKKLCWAETS